MGAGHYSWYTMFTPQCELIQPRQGENRRVESLAMVVDQVVALITALVDAGWRRRGIHLLGFSQGGTVALETARVLAMAKLRSERTQGGATAGGKMDTSAVLGSVVAVAASVLPEQEFAEVIEQGRGGGEGGGEGGEAFAAAPPTIEDGGRGLVPVLLLHGDYDTTVRREWVDWSSVVLRAAGCAVQQKHLPTKGHEMINRPDEMQMCMEFWSSHLLARAPPLSGAIDLTE